MVIHGTHSRMHKKGCRTRTRGTRHGSMPPATLWQDHMARTRVLGPWAHLHARVHCAGWGLHVHKQETHELAVMRTIVGRFRRRGLHTQCTNTHVLWTKRFAPCWGPGWGTHGRGHDTRARTKGENHLPRQTKTHQKAVALMQADTRHREYPTKCGHAAGHFSTNACAKPPSTSTGSTRPTPKST